MDDNSQEVNGPEDFFGPVISSYTRQDMLNDGEMIDVTELAKEMGFTIPVGITRNAWNWTIALPRNYRGVQDLTGRQWDVLWMAYTRILSLKKRAEQDGRNEAVYQFPYEVVVRQVNDAGDDTRQVPCRLWCNIGPGDEAEAVITIMTNEDL